MDFLMAYNLLTSNYGSLLTVFLHLLLSWIVKLNHHVFMFIIVCIFFHLYLMFLIGIIKYNVFLEVPDSMKPAQTQHPIFPVRHLLWQKFIEMLFFLY